MAARKTKATVESEPKEIESLFSKKQLLASARFQGKKDVLNTLLSDNEQYTLSGVEQKVKEFYEREVK